MADARTNGNGGGNWHDNDTWESGSVPADDDRIIVVQGDTLTIDGVCKCKGNGYTTSTNPSDAAIEIHGTLTVQKDNNTELHAKGQIWCSPTGSDDECVIDFGTEDEPIKKDYTFKWFINEDKDEVYNTVSALYCADNGGRYPTFSMVSEQEKIRNTYLIDAFDSGSNKIKVNDITGWQVGDKLWLAPRYTDPENAYKNTDFEEVTIKDIDTDNNEITLENDTDKDHGYSDEANYPAAGVANLTSNVQIIGAGNNAYFYRFYLRNTKTTIKNIEIQYGNNLYNYNNACIFIGYGNKDGRECIVTGNSIWSDSSNVDKHQKSLMYFFMPNPTDDKFKVDNNCFVTKAVYDGQYSDPRIAFYYGGSPVYVTNLCSYSGSRYTDKAFSDYQCPVTFDSCKAFGCDVGFDLNNNVDTTAKNCWVVGSNRPFKVYNGSAIYIDNQIRMSKYLYYMPKQWRGLATILRPKYSDDTIYYDKENFIYREQPLPNGVKTKLLDIQDNPKQQMLATTYGSFFRDTDIYYSSVASIKCKPVNKNNSLVFSTTKYVNSGKTIKVSVQLRKDDDYNGDTKPLIRLKCSQFDITQEMDDDNNEWKLTELESDELDNSELVTISIEGIGDNGHYWIDDLFIDDNVYDVGNELFFGGTEISNVVDITDTRTKLQFKGVDGVNLAVFDDNLKLVDFIENINNGYIYTSPEGAENTWTWIVKKSGYSHFIGTFEPNLGTTIIVRPVITQKVNPDGTNAYQDTSSDLLNIVFDGVDMAYIDIANGIPPLQTIFDKVERALISEDGLTWLVNGYKGISIFKSLAGDFLFLSHNWRLRRADEDDDNATVPAFVMSADGIPVDTSNGEIKFMTSDTAELIANKVVEMLNNPEDSDIISKINIILDTIKKPRAKLRG